MGDPSAVGSRCDGRNVQVIRRCPPLIGEHEPNDRIYSEPVYVQNGYVWRSFSAAAREAAHKAKLYGN